MSYNGLGGRFWGFLAFLVTMFAAVLYLLAMVLGFFDISSALINSMQSVASVIMICIVSVFGWRFVKSRSLTWRLLYVLLILAVVASVVVPPVIEIVQHYQQQA